MGAGGGNYGRNYADTSPHSYNCRELEGHLWPMKCTKMVKEAQTPRAGGWCKSFNVFRMTECVMELILITCKRKRSASASVLNKKAQSIKNFQGLINLVSHIALTMTEIRFQQVSKQKCVSSVLLLFHKSVWFSMHGDEIVIGFSSS